MPSVNPRVAMVLEPPLYEAIKSLAERDGVSLSHKSRDLIIRSLDLFEDSVLEKVVKNRKQNKAKSISHDKMKQLLGIE